jgi:hypothetical protein
VRNSCRNSRLAGVGIALALTVATQAPTSAHRLDEYLQAARIAIDPDRVELVLDLTPGTAVAGRVLAEIDRDGDRSVTAAEGHAYARQVLTAITLDVDRHPLRLELIDSDVPAMDAMLTGVGTLRLRAHAAMPALGAGDHELRYRNGHRPEVSVYLANALVPASDRVAVIAQHRDVDQRELTIDYTLRGDRSTRLGEGAFVVIGAAFVWLLVRRGRPLVRRGRPRVRAMPARDLSADA